MSKNNILIVDDDEKIAERILEDQEVLKSGAKQSRTGTETGRRVEDGTGENKSYHSRGSEY